MTDLGWRHGWIGNANREDITYPVLQLGGSAQRFGRLRRSRGQLLVTQRGRALQGNTANRWLHLAACLPHAREKSHRQAGRLYVMTIAAGRPLDEPLLAVGLAILGWIDSAMHATSRQRTRPS